MGSGLSSSAALEIALLRALREAFRLPLTDIDLARLGQRAENELVGAPVGIMDQMVCSLGQSGQALFLDTASLTYQLVPLPPSVELIVIDSRRSAISTRPANTARAGRVRTGLRGAQRRLPGIVVAQSAPFLGAADTTWTQRRARRRTGRSCMPMNRASCSARQAGRLAEGPSRRRP